MDDILDIPYNPAYDEMVVEDTFYCCTSPFLAALKSNKTSPPRFRMHPELKKFLEAVVEKAKMYKGEVLLWEFADTPVIIRVIKSLAYPPGFMREDINGETTGIVSSKEFFYFSIVNQGDGYEWYRYLCSKETPLITKDMELVAKERYRCRIKIHKVDHLVEVWVRATPVTNA